MRPSHMFEKNEPYSGVYKFDDHDWTKESNIVSAIESIHQEGC